MKQYRENSHPSAVCRTVMFIAVSLVAAEIVNTTILSRVVGPQPAGVVVLWMVRILVTSCLAYFIVRGARWARWIMAAFAVITVVRTAVVLIWPPYPPSAARLFIPWGVGVVLYYAAVACLLIFSKKVAAHFMSHRIPPTP